MEKITLGAGCFWCVEAIYQKLAGVQTVKSGYMGGQTDKPTYKEVCSGNTGHAEVVQIVFDPGVSSLSEILDIFWRTHDPTTLNQQGADKGTQYRSVIFYEDDAQKEIAEKSLAAASEGKLWDDPIVTEISAASTFFPAEAYHDNYFVNNPNQSYCQFVVGPKVEKFQKLFAEKLKD